MSYYKNKKITIIGRHGFIGSALNKALLAEGAIITSFPTPETDIVFHFGGPTHLPFEQNPDYFFRETLNSFLFLLSYCRDHNIMLVWPSSALVYETEKDTPFSHCKRAMEELQWAYPTTKILGLRIFPTYGPGEKNKGKYKTAIYQWCEEMKQGKAPVIYGDGTQTRDFLYIDDLIDNILWFTRDEKAGIMDIGAGISTSFNDIVGAINKALGQNIKPSYVGTPSGYSKGIYCKNPVSTKVSIEVGVKNIIDSL